MDTTNATSPSDLKTRIAALCARGEARAREEAQAHQDRMATLPPGTCETCYGTQLVDRAYGPTRCSACAPPPLVVAAGVPMEFRAARFDNFAVTEGNRRGLEAARAVVNGTRDLLLTGGVGVGKTRLAASIANECANARMSAAFARVPMVLHQLQPGRLSEEDAGALERRLFSTPVLVLDDVGAERDTSTDFTRRTLLLVYEERGDRGLRTIWTSNKTVQQLAEMADDDRLASRIAGRADVVTMTGQDWRVTR